VLDLDAPEVIPHFPEGIVEGLASSLRVSACDGYEDGDHFALSFVQIPFTDHWQ
jgi:hypothetical protein